MSFVKTTATRKIANLNRRIRAVQGGTRASKTVSIVLFLVILSQTDKEKKLTSVVSESTPHLKRGARRDFINIMQEHGHWDEKYWNATDSIYTFETGSQIEFFSADQPDKLRGATRDRLFINECNNIPFDAFEQLEVRTRDFIFLDWNPVAEFWFYEEIKGKRDDVEHITLTYLDNEALDKETIKSIEQRKGRKNWWKVYGLGELGESEGRIYTGWKIIDEVPHEAKLERYGLDFGYSNDPAAIVAVYRHNQGFILDEVTYLKGLSNKQLSDILLNNDNALVVADCAEPKSIDEISSYGVPMLASDKSKRENRSSVNWGIDLVKDQRIFVTKRSLNIIKEYRNYLWATDKNGKITRVPEDLWNHSMDAIRYALISIPKLVQPLTGEQKEARIFMEAMKRKHQAGKGVRDQVFLR